MRFAVSALAVPTYRCAPWDPMDDRHYPVVRSAFFTVGAQGVQTNPRKSERTDTQTVGWANAVNTTNLSTQSDQVQCAFDCPDLPYTEAPQNGPYTGTPPTRARCSVCEVAIVKNRPSVRDRRGFIRGVTLASMGGAVALNTAAQDGRRATRQRRNGLARPRW
jgi:hypothetical protein